ncbi:ferredoxin [Streptomyces sp. YS-3]|uniref:ferredoxin n=1 Tax=Streptomyces sp. YS-3 TaxID=3381352 RepID=UPI0038624683
MAERLTVEADSGVCMGTGVCAMSVPAVFTQREDDGTVIVKTPEPDPQWHEAVREAAYTCPMGAIRLGVTGPGPGSP